MGIDSGFNLHGTCPNCDGLVVMPPPTNVPTNLPTTAPTNIPTNTPTNNPTNIPTSNPTNILTNTPTNNPTNIPTNTPISHLCLSLGFALNTQTSNPTNPTQQPTNSNVDLTGFWYPDYETFWSVAGCKNTLPLPYNNVRDRSNYPTQLECCNRAYAGQVSGKCLSEVANLPTPSRVWYPDYETAWDQAGCENNFPFPFSHGSRPTYETRLACCRSEYAGQVSGVCLCESLLTSGEDAS